MFQLSRHRTRAKETRSVDPVVLVVGPGDRFLSGVSYYTSVWTAALGTRGRVALLQLRQLLPRILYPGRARVGSTDGVLPDPGAPVFNGLDWFWGLSVIRAWRFWHQSRPSVLVLQWWTGAVLHSYLVLAALARKDGVRIVVEFHEMQDVGEKRIPLMGRYASAGLRLLLRWTDAVIVHSEFDRGTLLRTYPQFVGKPIKVIPHGPYDHHVRRVNGTPGHASLRAGGARQGQIRAGHPVRLLIFGVVRPYKGHSEFADAARALRDSGIDVHVTVVGEVWQGYQKPLAKMRALMPADRIDIVDRYVDDADVPGFFAAADVVVLPYRRSSASGPLHIAMSYGLPVVTTAVGGLTEAASEYSGAVLVEPGDPAALAEGIRDVLPKIGQVHTDPHSWDRNAERFVTLMTEIGVNWGQAPSIMSTAIASKNEPSCRAVSDVGPVRQAVEHSPKVR